MTDNQVSTHSSNNKRLAKNTIVLYIRMVFVILISLYMSRLILDTLGVDDYGIYNVVGGFVTMFSLLSGSLSNSISRFITFELGRGDLEKLKKVFSASVTVQVILSIAIALIIEIVGVWFLNCKMQIPDGRLFAANWVLHCSIITFMLNLITVPFIGCIIAHERMTAFAYISILDVLLKLGAVILLYLSMADNLITYSVLVVVSSLITAVVYIFYCLKCFTECVLHILWDKRLIKEMISLASWNMLGSGAGILNNQGTNVVMNVFFGVTVNAARGIASQVNSALQQFASSFITAINPQITKLYAQNNIAEMQLMVHRGIKFSYYLMLLVALPIIIETPIILDLWLPEVPNYTIVFVRLTVIIALFTLSGNILFTTIMATGNIKEYQIVIGCFSLSIFLTTLLLFYLGMGPATAYIIHIIIDIFILFARLIIVNKHVEINVRKLITSVFSRIVLVTIVASILPVLAHIYIESNFTYLIVFFICLTYCPLIIYLIGLDFSEKNLFFQI